MRILENKRREYRAGSALNAMSIRHGIIITSHGALLTTQVAMDVTIENN